MPCELDDMGNGAAVLDGSSQEGLFVEGYRDLALGARQDELAPDVAQAQIGLGGFKAVPREARQALGERCGVLGIGLVGHVVSGVDREHGEAGLEAPVDILGPFQLVGV